MRRFAAVLAIVAAALVAAAALRRPDWRAYVEDDDGLPPDPYLERLR